MRQGVESQIHSGTNGQIALRGTVYGDFRLGSLGG